MIQDGGETRPRAVKQVIKPAGDGGARVWAGEEGRIIKQLILDEDAPHGMWQEVRVKQPAGVDDVTPRLADVA